MYSNPLYKLSKSRGKSEDEEQAAGRAHHSSCPSAPPSNQTKAAGSGTQIHPPSEGPYCLQPSICYTKGQARELIFLIDLCWQTNESVYLNIHVMGKHTHLCPGCRLLFAVTTLYSTWLCNKPFLVKISFKPHSLHLYQSGLESLPCSCNRLQLSGGQRA